MVDTYVQEAASYSPTTDSRPVPARGDDRIVVLDVLRGVALLGMFIVHFTWRSDGPAGGIFDAYRSMVSLFFNGRFYMMFSILFGVGFAVLLRRAETRGEPFVLRYVRRLMTLAVIGLISEVFFGFHVLFGYALWGFALLLVRKWSTKALVVTLVLCAVSNAIWMFGSATYAVATGVSAQQFRAGIEADAAKTRQVNASIGAQTGSTEYRTVLAGRLRKIPWFYTRPFSWLPFNLAPLLIGFLALRLGLFERPREHLRVIVGAMVFGAASWAAMKWVFPTAFTLPFAVPRPIPMLVYLGNQNAFGLASSDWLALTYIGAMLLVVAHKPAWLAHFSAFSVTGRMALTNYMLQVIVLSLAFAKYAFNLKISVVYGVLAALALFAANVAFSRWWLARYRYGPLEWVWRSVTYWQRQPMRLIPAAGPARGA